ncbi:diguanylate cyclase [Parafrankia sp. EAN1pec]|uniref:GGDEF domain-containing protein n=1 Tax=Parafrankia sp. (strain EAN1pec) TaxID=298653 RepID=UPI0000543F5B|nr:diguanylate cyclase [Frankia sp. EAN1pec]
MTDAAEQIEQVPSQTERELVSRTLFRWAILACTGYGAILLVVAVVLPDRDAAALIKLSRALALLLAGPCCLWCGWRSRGPERLWRVLMGVACIGATAGVGAAVRFSLEHYRYSAWVPPVSWIHMLYLLPYAAVLAALLVFPSTPLTGTADRTSHNGRYWYVVSILDSLLVVGSLGVLVWEIGLGELFQDRGDPTGLIAFAASNAIVSATVVVLLVLIATFRRPRSLAAATLLATGLLGTTFSTGVYLVARANHIQQFDPILLVVPATAPLIVALSCLVPPPRRAGPARRVISRTIWIHTVLPYMSLATVVLIFIFLWVLGSHQIGFGQICTLSVLLVLALVRQMMTMADNTRLILQLQNRERLLHHQAFHDPLTGLANRLLFTDRLQLALTHCLRDGLPFALLFCDIDRFKWINDNFGHAAGDELLRITATRMTKCTRVSDTVARLGGDEFAILLTGGGVGPETVSRRIVEAIHAPCTIAGQPYRVKTSAGLVIATEADGPMTADMLLFQADLAMYEAKRQASEKLVVYQPEMSLETGYISAECQQMAGSRRNGASSIEPRRYRTS